MDTNVVRVNILPATGEDDEQVEWYFNAVAANGEIVSTSETYTRQADAIRAAEGVFPGITQIVTNSGA